MLRSIRRPTALGILILLPFLLVTEAVAFAWSAALQECGTANGCTLDAEAFPEAADPEIQRQWAREQAMRTSLSPCCVAEAASLDAQGSLRAGPLPLNYCGKGLDCDCRAVNRQPVPTTSLLVPVRLTPEGSDEELPSRSGDSLPSLMLILTGQRSASFDSVVLPTMQSIHFAIARDNVPRDWVVAPLVPPPRN